MFWLHKLLKYCCYVSDLQSALVKYSVYFCFYCIAWLYELYASAFMYEIGEGTCCLKNLWRRIDFFRRHYWLWVMEIHVHSGRMLKKKLIKKHCATLNVHLLLYFSCKMWQYCNTFIFDNLHGSRPHHEVQYQILGHKWSTCM